MKNLKHTSLIAFALTAILIAISPRSACASGGQVQDGKADTIAFPGGPLESYVQVVRRSFPNANIVLADDAGQFLVPPLQLRNVQLHEAMDILTLVARPPDQGVESEAVVPSGQPMGTPFLNVRAVGTIWTISAHTPRGMPQVQQSRAPRPPAPAPTTVVFAVVDVLANFKAEDVFTSIETALGFTEDAPAIQLRLHEQTGLLIARGLPAQMVTVEVVIDQLRVAADMRLHHPAEGQAGEARAVETLRNEMRELEAENARLRAENTRLRQQPGRRE